MGHQVHRVIFTKLLPLYLKKGVYCFACIYGCLMGVSQTQLICLQEACDKEANAKLLHGYSIPGMVLLL